MRDGTELFAGLIPLHTLHHAGEKPVYGLWIIEELSRHGYKLSPGTLYPRLHRLEQRGLLRSGSQRAGQSMRRVYEIRPEGRCALADARPRVKKLFAELFESELHRVFGGREHRRRQRPREKPAQQKAMRPAAPGTRRRRAT